MHSLPATVNNIHGIHCRPSSAIVKAAKEFDSELSIKSDQGDAILSSILDLISLGLHQGAVITVCAEGSDEVAAAEKIVECVEAIYDYPDK
jgi:phosphocarrier protein HPr